MPSTNPETRYRTALEYVVEALRADILTDKLEPGQKLPLDSLAERFGTSVIPIREALRVLEAERLVERRPHRTAIVATLSLETIQDLYRVRLILDVEAVRMAHGKLSPSEASLGPSRRLTSVVTFTIVAVHVGSEAVLTLEVHGGRCRERQ